MKKIITIKTLMLICAIFLLLAVANKCSYTNYYSPLELKKGMCHLVQINTIGADQNKTPLEQKGVGIPLYGNMILTLSHITTFEPFVRKRSGPFIGKFPRTIISTGWFLKKKKLKLLGRWRDISLFHSSEKLQEFPIPFGDSSYLRLGDKLAAIAWPLGNSHCIKEGIVSRFDMPTGGCKTAFLSTIRPNPGDSGSPVIAYRHNPEIVGIIGYLWGDRSERFSIIYPINFVKKAIERILHGDGEKIGFNYFKKYAN